MKHPMKQEWLEQPIAGYAYGNQGKEMKPSNMLFSTEYIGKKQDAQQIKRIARNQQQVSMKELYDKPFTADIEKQLWQEHGKVPQFNEKQGAKMREVPVVRFDKKPSKKLPLEREFLTGDPEIDNAEYKWVSRIEVTDGKVVISWVPKRIYPT